MHIVEMAVFILTVPIMCVSYTSVLCIVFVVLLNLDIRNQHFDSSLHNAVVYNAIGAIQTYRTPRTMIRVHRHDGCTSTNHGQWSECTVTSTVPVQTTDNDQSATSRRLYQHKHGICPQLTTTLTWNHTTQTKVALSRICTTYRSS